MLKSIWNRLNDITEFVSFNSVSILMHITISGTWFYDVDFLMMSDFGECFAPFPATQGWPKLTYLESSCCFDVSKYQRWYMMDSCSTWNQYLQCNKVREVMSSWSDTGVMIKQYICTHLSERYIVKEISLRSSVLMMITRNRSGFTIFNAPTDTETWMHWKHARMCWWWSPEIGRVDMICFCMLTVCDMSTFCKFVPHLMECVKYHDKLDVCLMCAHMSWFDDDVLLFSRHCVWNTHTICVSACDDVNCSRRTNIRDARTTRRILVCRKSCVSHMCFAKSAQRPAPTWMRLAKSLWLGWTNSPRSTKL